MTNSSSLSYSATTTPVTSPLTPHRAEAAAIAAIDKASLSSASKNRRNTTTAASAMANSKLSSISSTASTASSFSKPPSIPHATSTTISPPRGGVVGSSVVPLLECDYDVNPTELYQAIEARQWEYCLNYFQKCTASKISRECQTWVVRKEPNGKLRWRLLPLHAAIIFQSPLDILEKLLGEFPAAAQCKDDQGMLPLHLAFRNEAPWNVLEELLTAHPQAIFVKDRKGRTPLQCCPSQQHSSHHGSNNISSNSSTTSSTNANAHSSSSSSSKWPSQPTQSLCTAKSASVMEMYTQIAVSSERQRALAESRALLEARIGALQESHVATLTGLKVEWEQQAEELHKDLQEKMDELGKTQQELKDLQIILAQRNATQLELTEKLQQVTVALNAANSARSVQESAERTKWHQRRSVWQESHQEMLVLIQGLLEQNSKLLLQLQETNVQRQKLYQEVWHPQLVSVLQELQTKLFVTPREESAQWQAQMKLHNQQANDRLAAILAKTKGLWLNETSGNSTTTTTNSNSPPTTATTMPSSAAGNKGLSVATSPPRQATTTSPTKVTSAARLFGTPTPAASPRNAMVPARATSTPPTTSVAKTNTAPSLPTSTLTNATRAMPLSSSSSPLRQPNSTNTATTTIPSTSVAPRYSSNNTLTLVTTAAPTTTQPALSSPSVGMAKSSAFAPLRSTTTSGTMPATPANNNNNNNTTTSSSSSSSSVSSASYSRKMSSPMRKPLMVEEKKEEEAPRKKIHSFYPLDPTPTSSSVDP